MECLNKKGLTTGTLVVLILILVSFLVLVVLVTNLNEIESYEGSRWICKLSILMGKFNCKTFGPQTLDNEQDVADKITDAWSTFFNGKKIVIYSCVPLSYSPGAKTNCFDYMRFKIKRDFNIQDINNILNQKEYQEIKDNIEFKGISNKLNKDTEYVVTFTQKYSPCVPVVESDCIKIIFPPRGDLGIIPTPLWGKRTSKIIIAPSKDIVSIAPCDCVVKV